MISKIIEKKELLRKSQHFKCNLKNKDSQQQQQKTKTI